MLEEKRWLNPSELKEEFGIEKSTQSKWRMKSSKIKIPFSKIGSKIIRYDRIKINIWLEKNEVGSDRKNY